MSQLDGRHFDELKESGSGFEPRRGGAQHNISETERFLSAAAGFGLLGFGVARGRWSGLAIGAMGAGLLWRGFTGRCECYAALGINTADYEHSSAVGVPAGEGVKLERKFTVDRPAAELYEFWRRPENLPQLMRHLKHVESIDHERSHWVAEGALGKDVEWDAEIHNDRENELIAWRSLPGGDIDTAGSVHFKPLGQSRRTEITLSMKYSPPAGKIGTKLASLFGDSLDTKLDEDLRRFKQVMETGMAASPGDAPPE